MDSLIHCVYASSATRPLSSAELQAILARAREKNAAIGVTGILLHSDGDFFQVLEGQAAEVDGLYERISADGRHARVNRIIREPIESRSFSDWSMGYAHVTRKELATVPGLNDFFVDPTRFVSHMDAGRARKLLGAFADGRWRG